MGALHNPDRRFGRVRGAALSGMLAMAVLGVGAGGAKAVVPGGFTFPPGSPLSSADGSFISLPSPCGGGANFPPSSVLNDGSHIFVATICENQKIYRFPETGGAASDPGVISDVTGNANGLALDNGTYFSTGSAFCCGEVPGVWTFDPNTLARGHQVTAGTGFNHNAAAVDPLTGNLYYGDDTPQAIRVIQNPASASPVVSQFVALSGFPGDLKWTADGSRLYVALTDTGNLVLGFDRQGHQVFSVDLSAHNGPTGLAIAPPNTIVNGIDVSNNLFIPAADGTIQRIDPTRASALSTVSSNPNPGTGALRKANVGPDGCLLVPYGSAVAKFAPCFFQPDVTGKVSPPHSTSAPSISGQASPGQVLSCATGAWDTTITSFAFGWNRDGNVIGGAVSSTYTPTSADVGHALTCTVTASNSNGSAQATSSPVTVTPASGPPGGGSPPRGSGITVRCDLVFAISAFSCTAVVADAGAPPLSPPSGHVRFDAGGKGVFSTGNTCTLVDRFTNASGIPVTFPPGASGCSVLYTPPLRFVPFSGPPPVKAFYLGDSRHRKSGGLDNFLSTNSVLPDPGGSPQTTKTTGPRRGGQFPAQVDVSTSLPVAGGSGVVCAVPGGGAAGGAIDATQADAGFGDSPPAPTPPESLAQVGQDSGAASADLQSADSQVARATRPASSTQLTRMNSDASRIGADLATARATRPDASASLMQFNLQTGHAQRPPPSAELMQFGIDPNADNNAVRQADSAAVTQCGGGVAGIRLPPNSTELTQFTLPPPDVARAERTTAGTTETIQTGPPPVPDAGGGPLATVARGIKRHHRRTRAEHRRTTLAVTTRSELSAGRQTFKLRFNAAQMQRLAHGRKRLTIRVYTIMLIPNIFFRSGQPLATVRTLTLTRTPTKHRQHHKPAQRHRHH